MTAAAVLDVQRMPAPPRRQDAASLLATLAQAEALVGKAQTRTVSLALDVSGGIVLPDITPASADDQALIRAVAPLYLAAQLEEAALLTAVETLCGLAIGGGLSIDLGAAAALIQTFWQHRNERFHENERRAFFGRLFGVDDEKTSAPRQVNAAFEDLLIDLSEALYKLDEQSLGENTASPHAQTLVLTAARNLAENLLNHAGGMAAFAAKEIVSTIQSAVEILQQPAVQHAVGAHSLWTAVHAVASRYLHLDPDTSSYVTRGKSGLIIMSWLADSLPRLNDGQPLVTLDHPVIAAATEWLQASLAIHDAGTRAETGHAGG
jgi:hypothetical protein